MLKVLKPYLKANILVQVCFSECPKSPYAKTLSHRVSLCPWTLLVDTRRHSRLIVSHQTGNTLCVCNFWVSYVLGPDRISLRRNVLTPVSTPFTGLYCSRLRSA